MANEVLTKLSGVSSVVWVHFADYANPGDPARTHEMDMTSLADGSAVQGAKADLGALMAPAYTVRAGVAWNTAPAAGSNVWYAFGYSSSVTAGTLNDGGLSGTATTLSSPADVFAQLSPRSSLFFRARNVGSGTVQIMHLGIIRPLKQYIMPAAYNDSGQALHTSAANMFLELVPLVPEIQ